MAAPVNATADQARSWLQASGFSLGANQFTYSIPGAGATWAGYAAGSEPFSSSYAPPNAALVAGFRAVIAVWDEIIAPDFTEVTENGSTVGELRVAFTDVGSSFGYAYSGTPQRPGGKPGDVWISSSQSNSTYSVGDYSYMALLHEVGHTLGLKHTFESPAAPAQYDNYRYSIMSYTAIETAVTFTPAGNGGLNASSQSVVAATPMVLDILAAQAIYGAETSTRAGDTVYTFSPRANIVQTIWDGGGTDRIDASNFTTPVQIDLRPGAYSSIGIMSAADQIAYWSALYPNSASFIRQVINGTSNLFTYTDNVAIAFGVTIENATGGSANDTLFGNDVGNFLSGGAGDDTLNGVGGNDTLDGGSGNDIFLVQDAGDVVIEARGGGTADTVYAAASYILPNAAEIENYAAATAISTVGLSLTGNQYGQAIAGTYGNDTIQGGGSSVNGGDILIGLRGDDLYTIDAPNILIIEAVGAAEGNDTAIILASGSGFVLNGDSYVETLQAAAGTATIAITGNALSQTIIGNDGTNVLSSGGGAGDTLIGGAGDDSYRVYGQQDVVRESAGQGADIVYASADYQLRDGASVEALSVDNQTASGAAVAYTLRGNELGQTIVGNDAANVLDGRGGNDTLIGRGGADVFAFTSALGAGNIDTISDFASGVDKIGLASDIFAAVTGGGILAGEFVAGTAALDGDDRLIYDQATGRLFYDADANGSGAAVLFAQLAQGTALSVTDFVVVSPVSSLAAA